MLNGNPQQVISPPKLEEFPQIAAMYHAQKVLGKVCFVSGALQLPFIAFSPFSGAFAAFFFVLGMYAHHMGSSTSREISNSLAGLSGSGNFARYGFYAARRYYLVEPKQLADRFEFLLSGGTYIFRGRNEHFLAHKVWHYTLEANVYAAQAGSCLDMIMMGRKTKSNSEDLLAKLG